MDWKPSRKLAEIFDDESSRSISQVASAYTDGYSARLPIVYRAGSGTRREYRVVEDPPWPAKKVRRLKRGTGMTYEQMSECGDMPKSAVKNAGREGAYAGRKLHPVLDELLETVELPPEDQWWGVCDVVCGRLVLSAIRQTKNAAMRTANSDKYYNHETCDSQIVKGCGKPPKLETRVDHLDGIHVVSE